MAFQANAYGSQVEAILALRGDGGAPMPLAEGRVVSAGVDALKEYNASRLFPNALSPAGALSGLYLYFCAYDESHTLSQDLHTAEGSFWHGIMHRQEPDPGNAGYWFRRVGSHAIFPALRDEAEAILSSSRVTRFRLKHTWDPFAFIDFCEEARRKPGSKEEEVAMAIQLCEWQLLFDHCARPRV